MKTEERYIDVNKASWNSRVETHLQSEFYDHQNFLKGKSSLNPIELDLLGNIEGLSVLHLQCHFGQDTLSLSRMGAIATGVDFSEKAIETARAIAKELQLNTQFICSDLYALDQLTSQQYDIVFTSYGTIGWLPDLKKWAQIVSKHLKPNGKFVMVDFHPVVWMYDKQFEQIAYRYFNSGPIIETETGSYADQTADMVQETIGWNHSISEILNSLIQEGLEIKQFDEFDYSPYNCFSGMEAIETGKYRIAHFGNKIPMLYAIEARKKKSM